MDDLNLGSERTAADSTFGEDFYNVDFTGVGDLPVGKALLQIEKVEPKFSTGKSNRMLNLQMVIVEFEGDPKFVGKKIFASWMLETDMIEQTFKAARAFLGADAIQKGPSSLRPDKLIGKQAWCLLAVEKGKGEYEGRDRTKVQTYGVNAPEGAGFASSGAASELKL